MEKLYALKWKPWIVDIICLGLNTYQATWLTRLNKATRCKTYKHTHTHTRNIHLARRFLSCIVFCSFANKTTPHNSNQTNSLGKDRYARTCKHTNRRRHKHTHAEYAYNHLNHIFNQYTWYVIILNHSAHSIQFGSVDLSHWIILISLVAHSMWTIAFPINKIHIWTECVRIKEMEYSRWKCRRISPLNVPKVNWFNNYRLCSIL